MVPCVLFFDNAWLIRGLYFLVDNCGCNIYPVYCCAVKSDNPKLNGIKYTVVLV